MFNLTKLSLALSLTAYKLIQILLIQNKIIHHLRHRNFFPFQGERAKRHSYQRRHFLDLDLGKQYETRG